MARLLIIFILPFLIQAGPLTNKGRSCSVKLIADHLLYAHIYRKEGNKSDLDTESAIKSLFNSHINAVNKIYYRTNFSGIEKLNFYIEDITIYNTDSCKNGKPVGQSGNPYCKTTISAADFLSIHSQRDYSKYCLAFIFTYRDFDHDELGLAWMANPSTKIPGGICQPTQKTFEGYQTLNTGIITLKHGWKKVDRRESELTFAHEIGHSLGAVHDTMEDANYLMYPTAALDNPGQEVTFSPASLENISHVLKRIVKSECLVEKPFSLQDYTEPQCKNGQSCDANKGYCDVNGECKPVKSEGPLIKFFKFVRNLDIF
uniref:Peptidase M12B domain-containing protein n=1 Tax=Rhabditophanes sp. KR3021 TaxID=114890 RepID=A0AC35TWF6_9BILA